MKEVAEEWEKKLGVVGGRKMRAHLFVIFLEYEPRAISKTGTLPAPSECLRRP